jgi:N6-adenosine-specific RNA methylase IME4
MPSDVLAPPDSLAALVAAEKDFVQVAHHIAAYCRLELETAQDVRQVIQSRHQVQAVHEYIAKLIGNRQQKLAAQNLLAEARLRQERWIGSWLRDHIQWGGGARFHDGTLDSVGVDKKNSHRWQSIAGLEEDVFETYIAETTTAERELTSAGALKLARLLRRSADIRERQAATHTYLQDQPGTFYTDLQALVSEGRRFACIYADPPWAYSNQGTRASTHNHYTTMTVEAICALPVGQLAADQCHLHLWCTNAFLFECPKIFAAWGFEFKSSFVWVKPHLGIGNYWRNSHEFLLLATRGGLTAQNRGLRSWLEADRTQHSAKPERIRDLVEALSPGPYLELFGRGEAPNWVVWGNECLPTNGRLLKLVGAEVYG